MTVFPRSSVCCLDLHFSVKQGLKAQQYLGSAPQQLRNRVISAFQPGFQLHQHSAAVVSAQFRSIPKQVAYVRARRNSVFVFPGAKHRRAAGH